MEDKFEWDMKVWGSTRCLVESQFYSKHELQTIAGGFSSFHYHFFRCNKFIVDSGAVRIVWAFGWEVNHRTLTAGNVFDIQAMVPHQFQVLESGFMFEEYYSSRGKADVSNTDIIRLSRGGRMDDPDSMKDTVGIIKEDGTFWEV